MTQVRLWTPEDKSMLCDLIEQGVTHAEIAVRINRTPRAVAKWANLLGAKSKNFPEQWPQEKQNLFLRYVEEGKNVYEIADLMGVSITTIKSRVQQYNVKAAHKLRHPPLTAEIKSRIMHLHSQQWGVKYIAKDTQISAERVRKFMRSQGVTEFYYERSGKVVPHRKWTPEEEDLLLTMQESNSTQVIAKRLNRSLTEIYNHVAQKGFCISQGRLTIKEFAEEIGVSSEGLSRRMRKLGIKSRSIKSGKSHTRGISPYECLKVLSDILENPGMFSVSNKRVKSLIKYYQDLRDSGRIANDET